MNQCTFLGRLTRDPEIRYTDSGMAIARFSIAVDRRRSGDNEQQADFFDCVTFDKRAEFVEKYLTSGLRILVSGEMHNNNYTNKNGDKVYKVELTANVIEFADAKRDRSDEDTPAQQENGTGKPASSGNRRNQSAPAAGNTRPAQSGNDRETAPAPAAGNTRPAQSGNDRETAPAPARQAASRRAEGRKQAGSAPRTGNDGFMNIPEGIEDEGLPFN